MFSTQKDLYARTCVNAYFYPEKEYLLILNWRETKGVTIHSDGSGELDNILDEDNERYSTSFSKGTFTAVFNKAKEHYEKNIDLCEFSECSGGKYPFLKEIFCTLGNEMTYLLLKEIKNNINDENIKNDW